MTFRGALFFACTLISRCSDVPNNAFVDCLVAFILSAMIILFIKEHQMRKYCEKKEFRKSLITVGVSYEVFKNFYCGLD